MGVCNKLLFFKILEMVLVGGCLTLHYQCMEMFEEYTVLVITGTFGAYVVIVGGYLASVVMAEPIPRRAWIFYSLVAVGLFVASGVLAIQYQTSSAVQGNINKATAWFDKQLGNDDTFKQNQKNMGIAKGAAALFTAVVFFADAIFTFRAVSSTEE